MVNVITNTWAISKNITCDTRSTNWAWATVWAWMNTAIACVIIYIHSYTAIQTRGWVAYWNTGETAWNYAITSTTSMEKWIIVLKVQTIAHTRSSRNSWNKWKITGSTKSTILAINTTNRARLASCPRHE